MKTPAGVIKMGETEVLPNARLSDLGGILGMRGYQVGGWLSDLGCTLAGMRGYQVGHAGGSAVEPVYE